MHDTTLRTELKTRACSLVVQENMRSASIQCNLLGAGRILRNIRAAQSIY
jgi:hypothetical protein